MASHRGISRSLNAPVLLRPAGVKWTAVQVAFDPEACRMRNAEQNLRSTQALGRQLEVLYARTNREINPAFVNLVQKAG